MINNLLTASLCYFYSYKIAIKYKHNVYYHTYYIVFLVKKRLKYSIFILVKSLFCVKEINHGK